MQLCPKSLIAKPRGGSGYHRISFKPASIAVRRKTPEFEVLRGTSRQIFGTSSAGIFHISKLVIGSAVAARASCRVRVGLANSAAMDCGHPPVARRTGRPQE